MKTLSQKIMALAIMLLSVTLSAYADTWTDPETGITWTYTVLKDGTVALGGGSSTMQAVSTSFSGELVVPAQINGLDVTSVMNNAFNDCRKITSIVFEPQNITLQKNAGQIFRFCSKLQNIDFVANWNTSNVTNMARMFEACYAITSLKPLSNWDTSKVTNMAHLFSGATNSVAMSITSIAPLANWDTSNVTNMTRLFALCTKITSLEPLANWNTSKVTNMQEMFLKCFKVQTLLPISNWDTSNVTNMYRTFQSCENLVSLKGLEKWNTGNVTTMEETFAYCSKVLSIESIANWNTSNVTTMKNLFCNSYNIQSLEPIANWNTSKVTNMHGTFANCADIQTLLPISNWDTSNVTTMEQTFCSCNNLVSLEGLENWDTSNVTTMKQTFGSCSHLTSLKGLEKWDTSNVITMEQTFNSCRNLSSLDALSEWNTGNVKTMKDMFLYCHNIIFIDPLANWNTASVTDMREMFAGCRKLTSLEPLANWNTSNVSTMTGMFHSTPELTYANDLYKWNLKKAEDLSEVFAFSGLIYINMSNWNIQNKNLTSMFANYFPDEDYNSEYFQHGRSRYTTTIQSRLQRIHLPKSGINEIASNMFGGCANLQEITIPSTVTSILSDAFNGCSSLQEITIPTKVTSIKNKAFYGCDNLTQVYSMANIPPTLSADAFGESTGTINKILYVKTSALEAYKADPQWSRFATITDMIPIVIGSTKNYSTLSFDFDADFSETEGVQPYIANKYLEGEDALDYISGFSEAKKRMSPALKKAADSGNTDIKLIVLAHYPDGYVPSRTGEDNFDFHGVILYGKPGTYYFKMGEQDFASDNPKTVTWNTNYMKSAYESWLLYPTYDHKPVNWMEYPKEDTYNFVLKNNVFKYIDNAGTINRHKSWLELPAEKVSGSYFEAGAKMISTFDPDEFDPNATGLSFIVEDEPTETQVRYNLNGQKVDANYKGIVISNGRKVLNQ